MFQPNGFWKKRTFMNTINLPLGIIAASTNQKSCTEFEDTTGNEKALKS